MAGDEYTEWEAGSMPVNLNGDVVADEDAGTPTNIVKSMSWTANGNQYDFDYSPDDDRLNLPPVPIMPPVVLNFIDTPGVRVERRLLDLAPSPESRKRFVQ